MKSPVFEFRYGHFGNVRRYGIALALVLVVGTYLGIADYGEPLFRALLLPAGFVVMFVAVYAGLHLLPHAVGGKRVAVWPAAIQVFRTELPAGRIAEVVTVDADTMWEWIGERFKGIFKLRFRTKGGRWQVEDRKVASFRFFYPWHEELPAVMVRDRDGGERPWWVFAVPDDVDPEEFAAAIRSVAPSLEETERGD